jgi:Family of unknown function (DUF6445)
MAGPVLHVIDSAFRDPAGLVNEAAQLQFRTLPRNPAVQVSRASGFAAELFSQVEVLLGVGVAWHPGCGNFRQTSDDIARTSGCMQYVHADNDDVIALWYLNRPEECHGGTGFFRHRATGLDGLHDRAALEAVARKRSCSVLALKRALLAEANDATKWERVDEVEMRANRLVVYDGRYFHSHILDFEKASVRSVRLTLGCWGIRINPCTPPPAT